MVGDLGKCVFSRFSENFAYLLIFFQNFHPKRIRRCRKNLSCVFCSARWSLNFLALDVSFFDLKKDINWNNNKNKEDSVIWKRNIFSVNFEFKRLRWRWRRKDEDSGTLWKLKKSLSWNKSIYKFHGILNKDWRISKKKLFSWYNLYWKFVIVPFRGSLKTYPTSSPVLFLLSGLLEGKFKI